MQNGPQAIQEAPDENPPPANTGWTRPSRTRVIVNLALFLVSLAASVWLVRELFIGPRIDCTPGRLRFASISITG